MTATAQQRVALVARFGGFWIRALAFLLDSAIIGIIVSLLSFGRAGLVAWDHWEPAPWRSTITTLVGLIYFVVLWSWVGGGRTIGMRLTGLRVVGTDGRPIGLGAAVLRWIGMVISAAVVLLGLVWVAFDQRKQGWHDRLAGTVVLRDDETDETGAWRVPTSGPIAADPAQDQRPIVRSVAVGSGFLGSMLACFGTAVALTGDAVARPGPGLVVVGLMTLVAILGAVVAWRFPAVGGMVLLGAAIAVGLVVGPLLGPWYAGLLAATAAGPAVETAYWSDAPATALLFMAGLTLGLAGLTALAGARPGREPLA